MRMKEIHSLNPFDIHLAKEACEALRQLLESGSSKGWNKFLERTKDLPKIPTVPVDPKDRL